MQFNIKEILYPSDADQIKWEKVNYNFDQILATGGKQGPKGEKGSAGTLGITGSKGEKGEIGSQGVKGDTGTSNIWVRFDHADLDSFVLKPKDDTKSIEPVIVLGDMGYDDGVTNGYLNPDAQLTIETGDSLTYALKLGALDRYSNPSLSYLTFAGEEDAGGTKWTIRPHTPGSDTKILIATDNINLDADSTINLSSVSGVNISGTGTTTINTNTVANGNVNINSGGILTVATGNTFFNGAGATKLQAGTTAQRPTPSINGMLRYNTTTGKFEGYANGTWLDVMRLSNPTKTTWISVQNDSQYNESMNDKIILKAANVVRISVNEIYNDGTPSINITGSTLFKFDQVNWGDIHINNATSSGKGLVFRRGADNTQQAPPGNKAPSNGISINQRRLNDHLAIKYLIDNTGTAKPLKTITPGATSGTLTDVTGYTSSSVFAIQYTKVGWNLSVNGYFKIDQNGGWPTSGNKQLLIDLGEDYRFPYTNWSNHQILVDIQLLTGKIEEGEVNDKMYGVIPAGQKRIYIWMERQTESSGDVLFSKIPLLAEKLLENSEPIEFLFNFNMPSALTSYYASDGSTPGGEEPEFTE